MLVLSRRKHQSIRIGSNIMIRIVRIRGDEVRIGIEAPKGVCIVRTELEHDTKGPGPVGEPRGG